MAKLIVILETIASGIIRWINVYHLNLACISSLDAMQCNQVISLNN